MYALEVAYEPDKFKIEYTVVDLRISDLQMVLLCSTLFCVLLFLLFYAVYKRRYRVDRCIIEFLRFDRGFHYGNLFLCYCP